MMEPSTSTLSKEAQVATSISRLKTNTVPTSKQLMLKLAQMAAKVTVGPTVAVVVL